ncbi:MAG: sigma 54-interacting transcriptional regulator [Magnetococcales bacterium]|nr:sigma 54-interacting transcriptional regulator [Magnetococcales bacterium]
MKLNESKEESIDATGNAPSFQAVMRAARLVAATDTTVLILGESGVGKELLAQSIHQSSHQAGGPFVPVNCAALSESLAESELFGHTRGAFTGAVGERTGRIAAAHGGTLFLDEIGDMPLSVQAKVLRFLETGECQVLGRERPRQVTVRIIAATHRNLAEMVAENRFRADLFYRLHVVPLHLPPLRERGNDVVLLTKRFLTHFSRRLGVTTPNIAPAAIERLLQHDWPGNIRELRNLCERAVVFQGGNTIDETFITGQLAALRTPFHRDPARSAATAIRESANQQSLSLQGPHIPQEGMSLAALEKELIQKALARTNGNRTRAAKLLDLTRDTLLYRMKKYALR